jgi:transcriptional regulator with XRE-family HTH domain
MVQKLSRARRKAMGITLNPRKGCWINFQLRLAGITQAAVAEKAGCNNRTVSDFLRGRKNSERVKKALAETLGYPSFEALIAASRGHDGSTV